MTTEVLMTVAPGRKPALHQSILAGLSKCSMQVYFRYVEGRKVPPGVALLVGQACHTAADTALVAKAKGEQPFSASDLADRARDALRAQWEGEGCLLDEEEASRGKAAVQGEAVDEATGLVSVWHRNLLPIRTPASPAHVERRLRGVLEGFPFDLEGTVDLQEADGSLRDLKTAARAPSEDAAIGNVQLDAYSLLVTLADGKPPARVGLDVLVKNKTPKHVIVEAGPPASFDAVTWRIEHAARVFQSGAFMPVDPHGPSGWVCSQKFCGYFDSVCPFGKRSRITVPIT